MAMRAYGPGVAGAWASRQMGNKVAMTASQRCLMNCGPRLKVGRFNDPAAPTRYRPAIDEIGRMAVVFGQHVEPPRSFAHVPAVRKTRRIVVLVVPPIEELDLVGPLQVMSTATRLM